MSFKIVFIDDNMREGLDNPFVRSIGKFQKDADLSVFTDPSEGLYYEISGLDIIEMINEDYIWFFDRNNGTFTDASKLIDRIKNLWKTRFDCILEKWILKHPEDADKFAFREAGGDSYTWAEMLKQLRLQTEVGKIFEGMVNEYYIYQLLKSEESNG